MSVENLSFNLSTTGYQAPEESLQREPSKQRHAPSEIFINFHEVDFSSADLVMNVSLYCFIATFSWEQGPIDQQFFIFLCSFISYSAR